MAIFHVGIHPSESGSITTSQGFHSLLLPSPISSTLHPPMPFSTSTLWKWTKRSLRFLFLLIVAAAVCGIIYQAVSTAYGDHKFPAPGILLDIGGRSMHIYCTRNPAAASAS